MKNHHDYVAVANKICEELNWKFISIAGSGAFKYTFKVENQSKELRALKIFKAGTNHVRQEREIHAMKKCSHPNIAKLDEIGSTEHLNEKFTWIIEEFLEGGTLEERLEKKTFKKDDIQQLILSLIDVLYHLKELNLVHRDLKPANIMYRNNGSKNAIVVDFGLVRHLDLESATKSFQQFGPGTPYFSSPEQLNNEKPLIDWRSDQFSLGIIISAIVFGKHPYEYPLNSNEELIIKVFNKTPLSDEFKRVTIDAGIEQLQQMVEPWPIQRFISIDKLKSAWVKEIELI